MSDTPRTDAAEKHAYEFKDEYTPVCESKLVRQLERELNAANESFRKLNIHVLDLAARIKRLEEAGDNMAEWLENPRNLGADACLSHAWREAKEAKP